MRTKIQMLVMLLMLTISSFNTQAATKHMTQAQAQARTIEIQQRVQDIRAMDFSAMSATDRKAVKHELKDLKKEIRQEPYIYISGAALILIIILLILLL